MITTSSAKPSQAGAPSNLLAESLPAAILGLQWPKTMYWLGGKSGPRFIRPIRWIVALLDDKVIPISTIAGVRSGNVTRGHRQLGSSSIPVTIENYETELRQNFVILSSHERRHKIEKEAVALGAKIDADLLETLTFITEFPTAIRGEFDPAFLELPAEVLTTVMRHHQKYFSVESEHGKLAPNFVAVMNTSGDPEGLVKHGNERVLKARFNDARFFWDVDQQKKLEDRVEDLKKVTFHVKLGSYLDKTNRIISLVENLGNVQVQNEALLSTTELHDTRRAARLCKADLTTEMVKELTELQGIVGGLYASAQAEPEAVWKAILEHYRPTSAKDSIPDTREGRILSLADKLDTLRECFRAGMIPSGSKDPFALRRAAQGVFKILIEAQLPYSLELLSAGDGALLEFLRHRYRHYFSEIYPYDEVKAVLAATPGAEAGLQSSDFGERLEALNRIRPTEDFQRIAGAIKRVRNIRKQADFHGSGSAILESSFDEGPEQQLYQEYIRVVKAAREFLPNRDYFRFLETVASTRPAVDSFFDQVMVMDTNPAIRERRLELLYRIDMQFNAIADFSEIVTSGEQK